MESNLLEALPILDSMLARSPLLQRPSPPIVNPNLMSISCTNSSQSEHQKTRKNMNSESSEMRKIGQNQDKL